MKHLKPAAWLCAALCMLSLSGCGSESSGSSNAPAAASVSKLPGVHSFKIGTISGGSYTESLLQSADVTVINIWQTTCPPCIQEMPDLALLESNLPENVQLLTWCLDGSYNEAKAKQILHDAGFSGKTIITWDGDLNTLLGQIMYTPTTVFLDREGNMVSEEIIGAGDVITKYTEHINAAMRTMGKDEIRLGI